jgi:hypothetical protein
MSHLTPLEGFLQNLAGKIEKGRREYLPREEAYKELKEITGQDFGYDVRKWREWIKAHGFMGRQRG